MPSKSFLTRRQFLKGAGAAGLVTFSAASAYGSLYEVTDYEITETDIFIRDLPASFDGFRIVQLTDIHHSLLVLQAEVRRVVELANGVGADMAVLTGDYTTARVSYIEPCAEALGELRAAAGVWAVLGNHDHYTDAELTTRALQRRGINVLNNANTVIRRGGEELQLVGIDDWSWGQTRWPRALHNLDPARPSILLSHQPLIFDHEEAASFSLIISGHTHGGQISLPFIGAPARFIDEFKYLRGLYQRGDHSLYVSRGTGVVGLPVRLGARPEIAALRLRAIKSGRRGEGALGR